jgi:hypothetical protein
MITFFAIQGYINSEEDGAIVNAILMSGLAITFAVIWLHHAKAWAKIATIITAVIAIASLIFTSSYNMFWPIAIILAGIYVFFTALRPKQA